MINRDSWGYSYLIVRGEILGFMKDELMRKHLPRMFSLIKNESQCALWQPGRAYSPNHQLCF